MKDPDVFLMRTLDRTVRYFMVRKTRMCRARTEYGVIIVGVITEYLPRYSVLTGGYDKAACDSITIFLSFLYDALWHRWDQTFKCPLS
jgi:hypothetical protein